MKHWCTSQEVEITLFAYRMTHEMQVYKDGFCYQPNIMGEKSKDIQYNVPAEEIKIIDRMKDRSACDVFL